MSRIAALWTSAVVVLVLAVIMGAVLLRPALAQQHAERAQARQPATLIMPAERGQVQATPRADDDDHSDHDDARDRDYRQDDDHEDHDHDDHD